jgi:hypothetical protein
MPPIPPKRAVVSVVLASSRMPAQSAAPAAITSFDLLDLRPMRTAATIPASQINSQK